MPSFTLTGIFVATKAISFKGENLMDCAEKSLDPINLFGSLPVARAGFLIKVLEDIEDETYLGSTFRGMLGWQLQNLSCPYQKRPPCNRCIIKEHCPAFILIEGKSPIPGLSDSPRGYILYPFKIPAGKASYQLSLTLLGDLARFYPLIRKALANGQKAGIGRQRARYTTVEGKAGRSDTCDISRLEEILEATTFTPGDIAVHLITPLRLRKKGKYLDELDWPFLLESTARRLEALSVLYAGGKALGKETWQALASLFSTAPAPLSLEISWKEYERYSNRQRRKVPMGGLVGKAHFDHPPEWFAKWLYAASLLHVGKGAAMGLGRIEIF